MPEDGVSKELLDSQVHVKPASTKAVEVKLYKFISDLENVFAHIYNQPLFTHPLDEEQYFNTISRFHVSDHISLLRLAKELVRIFTDRLNVKSLREISSRTDKKTIGSNKLFGSIIAEQTTEKISRNMFGAIFAVYELRIGDAHPTSSKISDSLELLNINSDDSFISQGVQMIDNYGYAIWSIGKVLFDGKIKESLSKPNLANSVCKNDETQRRIY